MQKLSFLPSEKASTIWSADELKLIEKSFVKKHSAYLENETFTIVAEQSKEQVQIKIVLQKIDLSVVYPIECVFVKELHQKVDSQKIAMLMLDYLDVYWTEYFAEDREVFLPIDWSKHDFEGLSLYMRGFIRNLNAENQADAFLQQYGCGEYQIDPISSET